jgi:hypothetical protein
MGVPRGSSLTRTKLRSIDSGRLVKIAHFTCPAQTYQQLSPGHPIVPAHPREEVSRRDRVSGGQGERMVTGMVTNSPGLPMTGRHRGAPTKPESQTNQHPPSPRSTEQTGGLEDFKTGALNHSATLPTSINQRFCSPKVCTKSEQSAPWTQVGPNALAEHTTGQSADRNRGRRGALSRRRSPPDTRGAGPAPLARRCCLALDSIAA